MVVREYIPRDTRAITLFMYRPAYL